MAVVSPQPRSSIKARNTSGTSITICIVPNTRESANGAGESTTGSSLSYGTASMSKNAVIRYGTQIKKKKTAEVQSTRLCPYLKNQILNYQPWKDLPNSKTSVMFSYDFSRILMKAERMTTSLDFKTCTFRITLCRREL